MREGARIFISPSISFIMAFIIATITMIRDLYIKIIVIIMETIKSDPRTPNKL